MAKQANSQPRLGRITVSAAQCARAEKASILRHCLLALQNISQASLPRLDCDL